MSGIQARHGSLPPFAPIVQPTLLPYLAFLLLTASFALSFYFSTLQKATIPLREITVALLASILAGFGIVALFCSVGVYV